MSGNSFGQLFVLTTAGESHGPAYLAIIDGCPPGMPLVEQDIQIELDRRRPGFSHYTTQRRENDDVEIMSGVFEGKTTGTPIGLLIRNHDFRSSDYSDIATIFRPGHADFTYYKKYGLRDYRGGGRASARETVMRVAAGAIAKKYLKIHFNLEILGCMLSMGNIQAENIDFSIVNHNPFFFPDENKLPQLKQRITELRRAGDSVGGCVRVLAKGVPLGLGEPVFSKLNADIACAMMGINAVKGVEIGAGFAAAEQQGTVHRDEMDISGFLTNQSGGVLGGISTGQDLRVTLAFKPTSSITRSGRSLDLMGNPVEVITKGRHDPCVAIRAVPIAEAMLALVLMDHLLRDRAQNFDVLRD